MTARGLILLTTLALLGACEAPSGAAVSAGGTVLATEAVETISEALSAISIDGSTVPITRRTRRQSTGRYQETLYFVAGNIFHERSYGAGFGDDTLEIIERTARTKFFVDNGLQLRRGDIKTALNANGALRHVTMLSDKQVCFVGAQMLGPPRAVHGGPGSAAYLRALRCATPTEAGKLNLEESMVDLIGRLRFDGGELNRARAP